MSHEPCAAPDRGASLTNEGHYPGLELVKSLGALFLGFFLLLVLLFLLWRSRSGGLVLRCFASAAGRLGCATATAVAGALAAAFTTTTAVVTVTATAALVAAALATAGRLLFTAARGLFFANYFFLGFATAGRLLFAARRFAAATTAAVQAAEQATVAAVAAVAAMTTVATAAEQAAEAATAAAVAATVAAAATVTEGIRLRFETDQDQGDSRESQHHLQCIALHQNSSKHMKKKL